MKLLKRFPITAVILALTLPSVAQDKALGELVVNPGFETTDMGVPTGWDLGHFVTTLSPFRVLT